MIRRLVPLACLCVAVVLSLRADEPPPKKDPPPADTIIRWFGHSFFEITSTKGTRICIDPHAIEGYGRNIISSDVCLCSHLHEDHQQVGVIDNAKCKVIQGVKIADKKPEWNPTDETFKDAKFKTVGVYHDKSEGMERGKNSVFIIEVGRNGLRIVHLGDLGHVLTDAQVKEIGAVDVLMIPVGGVVTLNGADAKKVVAQLKPTKYILPMHFGYKDMMTELMTAEEFLEDQKNKLDYDTNKLIVKKDFKPKEPEIAVLHYTEKKEPPVKKPEEKKEEKPKK